MIRYFILLFILSSCEFLEVKAPEDVELRKMSMKASVFNPKVPSDLWDKVEEQYNMGGVDEYSEELDRKKTKMDPPKKVFSMKVKLIEKNIGSLSGLNYELDFGSSGNFLDLKDFLNEDKRGSFFLSIDLLPDIEFDGQVKPSFKVFHLSNSKKLKIDGEVHGNGCNEFRDITSFYLAQRAKGGFLVSSKSARHISLLAGTFVFVAVDNETLYFSSLTVTDSRYLNFTCRK